MNDDETNDAAAYGKTLLEQLAEDGIDEFYITLDLNADVGPGEFKVAFIDPKAKK